jgi:hypothetical protein
MINRGVVGSQIEVEPAERCQEAEDKPKSVGNLTNLSSPSKERIMKKYSQPVRAAIRHSWKATPGEWRPRFRLGLPELGDARKTFGELKSSNLLRN